MEDKVEDKIIKSYISKEEFISMLNLINFKAVEDAELNLITGIEKKEDRNNILTKNICIS